MAGNRQSKDTDLLFLPGVVTNLPDRDARGRWKDSNRIRWFKGLAEKIGGWVRQTLTGVNDGVMIGTVRALHDWASLDTQQWISAGSECKLYLVNNGTLFDITPLRRTSNTSGSLSVTMGSPTITVTDIDHRANEGDHIAIIATDPVGGFDVSGTYDIDSVIDPDTFTVTFTSNFNSTQTGGGSVSLEYDVSCGLAENGELRGYGTGEFGEGTYGTPRPVGAGVPARMRTWSLDNWGEDLVASYSDGELYWWDKTTGPNSRAILIPEAPTGIQRMLVNPENRHLILLGCSGLDGVFDPMLVRWCSQEDFYDWVPTPENTAGDKRLDYGSRLITGIRSRAQNYIWSDTQMYSMQYVGPDFIFTFTPLGACKIVGPNAAVDVNGITYFMGFDDFFVYDGTLRVIPCDVHTHVFGDDRNTEGTFDRTQAEGVYCASYMAKNEVTWFYPTSTSINYVTINYSTDNPCFYYGQMSRTAYHDVSEAITGYKTNPYGAYNGYLYKHEFGKDEVEGAVTNPQDWFLESYDNNVGGSDAVILVNAIVPNFDRMSGAMLMTLRKKAYPRQQAYQDRGPYRIDEDTLHVGLRCKASQIALRLESEGETGEDFRMGIFQVLATPYGGRMGIHSDEVPPGAPVLSAEFIGPDAPVPGEVYVINTPIVINDVLAGVTGDFNYIISYPPEDDGNTNRMVVVEVMTADNVAVIPDVQFGGRSMESGGFASFNGALYRHRHRLWSLKLDGTEVGTDVDILIQGAGEMDVSARLWTLGDVGAVVFTSSEQASAAGNVTFIDDFDATGLTGAMLLTTGTVYGANPPSQLELNDPTGFTYTETDFPTLSAQVLVETQSATEEGCCRAATRNLTNEIVSGMQWNGDLGGNTPIFMSGIGILISHIDDL